jgi:hypothetical protein
MKKLIPLITLIVVFTSCKKEKTTWDSDWSAPLISDTLSLKNLVNDSTLLETGGFYALDLNREIFNLDLTELIEIPDTTIAQNFTFSVSLTVTPGFSFINSIEEHFLDLKEVQLKQIVARNGFIDIKVINPLPTAAIFKITLPGVTKSGVVFTETYTAPSGTTSNPGIVEKSIDLSWYSMDLTGVSGGDYNYIKSQVEVKSDPLGPTVTVTPSDLIKFEAKFRDVKVDYARGYFGNRIIEDTTEVFIEALQSVAAGTIDIPNTSLQFIIENGIKVSAEGTLVKFTNENASGTSLTLVSPYMGSSLNISPATGSWNTLTPFLKTLIFNQGNSNIEQYIGNLGAKHKLIYRFQINPWGNVSGGYDELFPNSRLKVKLKATMPLSIGVNDLVIKDTFKLELNQDPEKTRITGGELILNTSNAFPIGGSVKIHLLDQSGNVLHTVVASSDLLAAQFGAFSSTYNFNLANSELHFLLGDEVLADINAVRKVAIEAKFASKNPITSLNEPMSIPVDAFLAFKLKAKLTTEMKY